MLTALVVLLLLFWIGGLLFHIAGAFINVLLVLAIVVFVARFFTKRAF